LRRVLQHGVGEGEEVGGLQWSIAGERDAVSLVFRRLNWGVVELFFDFAVGFR
jgi:hypothetical protein